MEGCVGSLHHSNIPVFLFCGLKIYLESYTGRFKGLPLKLAGRSHFLGGDSNREDGLSDFLLSAKKHHPVIHPS